MNQIPQYENVTLWTFLRSRFQPKSVCHAGFRSKVAAIGRGPGDVFRSRTPLKFWSATAATMFWAAAQNFGPLRKFELPLVIADSVLRATRVFSLALSGSRDWSHGESTWSRSPDAGHHIGKFSLWTTLLQFSRSAQISLFSNFTKLGQLFFDDIFFGLTS